MIFLLGGKSERGGEEVENFQSRLRKQDLRSLRRNDTGNCDR